MSRTVTMGWHLRQVMASRGMYQTSELIPLLEERAVHLSREHVYRLVARTPQRVTLDVLAALCDALDCDPGDLLVPTVVDVPRAKTGTNGGGAEAGPGVGDLRPIRAKVRRPDQ